MNIHEYQAKEILRKFGVPCSPGIAAFTVDEAVEAAKNLNHPLYVVKSQIHAGGRGKGTFKELPAGSKGGVRLAKTLDDVKKHSEEMLGKTLVTIQNAPDGNVVKRLYIEAGSDIVKEYYLSLLVDRATSKVCIIASSEGGMDIEKGSARYT
jgi:succinyl-CoA synthetase beta subunit